MLLNLTIFVALAVLTFSLVFLLSRSASGDRTVRARVVNLHLKSGEMLGDDVPQFLKQTKLSEFIWLDHILQQWNLAHQIRLLLAQAESNWTVLMVLTACLVSAGVGYGVSYIWVPDFSVDIIIAILFGALPFFLLQWKKKRRMRRFDQGLPDAIDLIVRALRAGHSVSAAIELVGEEAVEPVRSEFREVYKQQNFGLPHREALLQLARRMPSSDLQFMLTAMLVQKETGGNLVDILDRTTTVIRERMRIEGEVRIYTAQGRLTGAILAALPIIMFFLINLANNGYSRILIEDPLGRRLISAGLGSMLVGGLIIRKIVNVKV